MICVFNTSFYSSHSCGTKPANPCESVDTCGNSYKLSVFDWLSNIDNPSESKCNFVEVRFKNDLKHFYKFKKAVYKLFKLNLFSKTIIFFKISII